MNNTKEILQWFKGHENSTLMYYGKDNNSYTKIPIDSYKVELDNKQNELKIIMGNGGIITLSLEECTFITDKSLMHCSEKKSKLQTDEVVEYDIQLYSNYSINSFVVVKYSHTDES